MGTDTVLLIPMPLMILFVDTNTNCWFLPIFYMGRSRPTQVSSGNMKQVTPDIQYRYAHMNDSTSFWRFHSQKAVHSRSFSLKIKSQFLPCHDFRLLSCHCCWLKGNDTNCFTEVDHSQIGFQFPSLINTCTFQIRGGQKAHA